jgi:hypothetical protein
VQLEPGSGSPTAVVKVSGPSLHTTQAQVTNRVGDKVLQTYSGIAENEGLDNLALQFPGVAKGRSNDFSNANGVGLTVNGLRGRNNDEQIDGQDNNDTSVGGPNLFVSNPEFAGGYEIVTNSFGPEYGRNSASVVNILTKSGTNDWHGTFSLVETNSVLETLTNVQKNFQNLTKVPRSNTVFPTLTAGGPIWKKKVFFFGGFDAFIHSSQTVSSNTSLTPTPAGVAAMAGCWPNSSSVAALQVFGPYGINGGNPAPFGTPAPVLLNGAPVPNAPGGGCSVEMAGVRRTLDTSFHTYDGVYRVDAALTGADRLSGRYLFNKEENLNNDFGASAAGYPVSVNALSQYLLLDWTHTFSSRASNQFRAGYDRLNVQFAGNSLASLPPLSQVGNALATIQFSQSGLLGFGSPAGIPQGRVVNIYQAQENFAFTAGRHQFKAGAGFTNKRTPITQAFSGFNGRFQFLDWRAFAANQPSFATIADGSPQMEFREHDTLLYAGDDWKLKNNLTLNLGITWSYFSQPANFVHDETLKQQSGKTPFWNPALPASVTTVSLINSQKNNWGPGAGFAWTPRSRWLLGKDGKTVIRGGYRLSYDPGFYNVYLLPALDAPRIFRESFAGTTMPANPTGANVRQQLSGLPTLGVEGPRSFAQRFLPTNFAPDRVHTWTSASNEN